MKPHQRFFLLLIDLILILCSLLLALLLRFENGIPLKYLQPNLLPYLSLCLFSAGTLYLFGLYNKLWRYASVEEFIHLFNALTVSFGIFAIPVFATHGAFYPRGVAIMAWVLALFLLGGVRLLLRLASSGFVLPRGRRRVIVVGGGDAGETVIRELKRENSIYWPVGIIDDNLANKNVKIHGVPILGTRKDLPQILQEKAIHDVVVTTPSPSIMKEILEACKGLNVEFKTVPGVHELMNGKVKLSTVRDIRIEDLLGREPIHINLESIKAYLSGKTILVTGAGGSIGSELCRQIASFKPAFLLLLGHGENSIYEISLELSNKNLCPQFPIIADVRDTEKMKRILQKFKPDVVFHAAAHKHVPFMELQPFEAMSNNFIATCFFAELCQENAVKKFVYLSTDKSVQPASIMGATKRLGEMYLQALQNEVSKENGTQFISVRFGNVLDSRGSVIPTFRKQIALGGPVTITHPEMMRYFMTIPEAVQLVLQAAGMGKGGEIFLLDMGRPMSILDLAHQMIRLAGYEPEKEIPIKIIGPRPGEKLQEKLLSEEEKSEQTSFEKIFLVRSRTSCLEELKKAILEIRELAKNQDEEGLRRLIKKLIPEYLEGSIPEGANSS
jgi:FlaA1/EpsC-like NDP-sugar epimerase